jgi:putative transposase
VPQRLKRFQNFRHLHFITFSCFHREPLLKRTGKRNLFLKCVEATRAKLKFVVIGYVVMPEHVHLLLSEPERGSLALAMQMLKQTSSRKLRCRRKGPAGQGQLFPEKPEKGHFWQPRCYDFNVWSAKKKSEKLHYMHNNPVTRGLVQKPEDWGWSSYRAYAFGEEGVVKLNDWPMLSKAAQA